MDYMPSTSLVQNLDHILDEYDPDSLKLTEPAEKLASILTDHLSVGILVTNAVEPLRKRITDGQDITRELNLLLATGNWFSLNGDTRLSASMYDLVQKVSHEQLRYRGEDVFQNPHYMIWARACVLRAQAADANKDGVIALDNYQKAMDAFDRTDQLLSLANVWSISSYCRHKVDESALEKDIASISLIYLVSQFEFSLDDPSQNELTHAAKREDLSGPEVLISASRLFVHFMYHEALSILADFLERSQQDTLDVADIHSLCGLIFHNLRCYRHASDHFDKSLSCHGQSTKSKAITHYWYADTLLAMGEDDKGLDHLARCINLDAGVLKALATSKRQQVIVESVQDNADLPGHILDSLNLEFERIVYNSDTYGNESLSSYLCAIWSELVEKMKGTLTRKDIQERAVSHSKSYLNDYWKCRWLLVQSKLIKDPSLARESLRFSGKYERRISQAEGVIDEIFWADGNLTVVSNRRKSTDKPSAGDTPTIIRRRKTNHDLYGNSGGQTPSDQIEKLLSDARKILKTGDPTSASNELVRVLELLDEHRNALPILRRQLTLRSTRHLLDLALDCAAQLENPDLAHKFISWSQGRTFIDLLADSAGKKYPETNHEVKSRRQDLSQAIRTGDEHKIKEAEIAYSESLLYQWSGAAVGPSATIPERPELGAGRVICELTFINNTLCILYLGPGGNGWQWQFMDVSYSECEALLDEVLRWEKLAKKKSPKYRAQVRYLNAFGSCAYWNKVGLVIASQLDQIRLDHGIETMYLVPSGPLAHLPIHAMPINGNGGILLDNVRVSYLSSSDSLMHMKSYKSLPPEPLLAAFVDPEGNLPGATQEVANISGMTGIRTQCIRQGESATTESFWNDTSDINIALVSMHSVVRRMSPLSYLQFYDSQLFSHEIMSRPGHFRNSPTVILDSCSTASRDVRVTWENLSLLSSFMIAGAATVISPLWEVNDLFAGLLIERMVKAMHTEALDPLTAMQIAVTQTRGIKVGDISAEWKEAIPDLADMDDSEVLFSHPYFWAPFIVMAKL